MSFLIIIDKKKHENLVDIESLKQKLCPYNSSLSYEKISDRVTLFYTNLVSRTDLNRGVPLGLSAEFRLPFNHQKDPGIAWGIIDVQNEMLTVQADPVGQLPLFIYEDESRMAVSCEQKAFYAIKNLKIDFNFNNITFKFPNSDLLNVKRLQANHQIRLDVKQTTYQIDRKDPIWKLCKPNENLSESRCFDVLSAALRTVARNCSPRITASLLSGGIDSSLATSLVKSVTDTYNLKTKHGDEESQSQYTANFLNRKTHTIDFDGYDVEKLFQQVIYANEISEGLSAEIFIQLCALIQAASQNHKYVLTGYGADYLFGGMLKHKLFMQLTGCTDTESLIDRAIWAKEFSPFYAWQIGVIPVHFYWNEDFMEQVLQIPLEYQFFNGMDKHLLRTVAVSEKWLVPEISFRPKLALTNGTQMNKIFSDFLKLPDEFSYDEKTRISQEKFFELIST